MAETEASEVREPRPRDASKDAVETAIDRSKEHRGTWESAFPSYGRRWSKNAKPEPRKS